ncbi:polysaccharide deacetylase family protein [Erythrobacter aurantius]|uniref:polysaccharide deacetylase family protein n=1 Tax=Erythrobacter aurantius TaxID=2909249 RepID=UPI00207B059C|nr:polysaccharide deacetylase family protein [Erythrobacter aurantius]
MIDPPCPCHAASFPPEFGQRALLTIDTEEEFDWEGPFSRDRHGLKHVEAIPRFQAFCEQIGAHPVYLVDWPIATDARAVEIIGDALRRGKADIGAQLHPWVNPPFEEEVNARNSYAGSLPVELEAAKLSALCEQIDKAFGTAPLIYRAGRYGLGPNSAEILKANGIAIDTSVRSLFDYRAQSGPDYTHHPVTPYWVDDDRRLLELPVTSVYWGLLRQMGKHIHRAQRHVPTMFGGFSRLRLLERIALTPEGVTAEEAIRGIDIALDEQLPVLVLSLHSPTLAPGFTPYTRTEQDVEALYSWLHEIYAYLDGRGVESTTVADIIKASRA